MSYAPPPRSASVQQFIAQAHTKLLVYFLDGNVRTWYGRHNFKSNRPANDPRTVEIHRHERSVAKNAAFIKVALIYNTADGREIARFKKGEWL